MVKPSSGEHDTSTKMKVSLARTRSTFPIPFMLVSIEQHRMLLTYLHPSSCMQSQFRKCQMTSKGYDAFTPNEINALAKNLSSCLANNVCNHYSLYTADEFLSRMNIAFVFSSKCYRGGLSKCDLS